MSGPAPQVFGAALLSLPMLNPEIYRFLGFTLDDKGIITGPLELGTPEFADLRFGDTAGYRGFGDDAVAATSR